MLKYAYFSKKHASNVNKGSFNGTLQTEHNDTAFVAMSEILMEQDYFLPMTTFDKHNEIINQLIINYTLTEIIIPNVRKTIKVLSI